MNVLDGLNALNPAIILIGLNDYVSGVLRHAIKLSEQQMERVCPG